MLPDWLAAHSLPPMSVAEAATNVEVLASLQKAVDSANEHVSRAESIRKIKVLTTDFTEANGLLTPSLKVKRLEATRRPRARSSTEIYGGPCRTDARAICVHMNEAVAGSRSPLSIGNC